MVRTCPWRVTPQLGLPRRTHGSEGARPGAGVRVCDRTGRTAKHAARGDEADFPKAVGYGLAGVVTAVGEDAHGGATVVAHR